MNKWDYEIKRSLKSKRNNKQPVEGEENLSYLYFKEGTLRTTEKCKIKQDNTSNRQTG